MVVGSEKELDEIHNSYLKMTDQFYSSCIFTNFEKAPCMFEFYINPPFIIFYSTDFNSDEKKTLKNLTDSIDLTTDITTQFPQVVVVSPNPTEIIGKINTLYGGKDSNPIQYFLDKSLSPAGIEEAITGIIGVHTGDIGKILKY